MTAERDGGDGGDDEPIVFEHNLWTWNGAN